jgi:hypothetical protein
MTTTKQVAHLQQIDGYTCGPPGELLALMSPRDSVAWSLSMACRDRVAPVVARWLRRGDLISRSRRR